jgi:hypothetical protein
VDDARTQLVPPRSQPLHRPTVGHPALAHVDAPRDGRGGEDDVSPDPSGDAGDRAHGEDEQGGRGAHVEGGPIVANEAHSPASFSDCLRLTVGAARTFLTPAGAGHGGLRPVGWLPGVCWLA